MDKPIIGGFQDFSTMILQKYERYLPSAFDENLTILGKVNKVIQYLDQIGQLTNDVVDQWNAVMAWVVSDGINQSVLGQLNVMVSDGTFQSLIDQTLLSDLNTGLANLQTSVTANTTNITNLQSSFTSMQTTQTTDEGKITANTNAINGAWINIKYPPTPLAGAKVDGSTDDSSAITAIANYLYSNYGGGTLYFPRGITAIGSTIFLPLGVNVQGDMPSSHIIPLATFNGNFLFESLNGTSSNTHHQIRDIYLDFTNNGAVGGIWLHKPYDYTSLTNVIGNNAKSTFIKLGDLANSGPGQTVKVDSCLVYSTSGRTQVLLDCQHMQECLFINNKFFGYAGDNLSVASFDTCSQMTLIGNSFMNSNVTALVFKVTNNNFRLSGNHISHNLFEACNGTYAIELDGVSGSTYEGDSNSILMNRYYNSSSAIYINGVVGTQIHDYASSVVYGSGARRSQFISPYNSNAFVNANGNAELAFDGQDIRLPVQGSGIVLVSPDGTKKLRLSVDNTGALSQYILSQ